MSSSLIMHQHHQITFSPPHHEISSLHNHNHSKNNNTSNSSSSSSSSPPPPPLPQLQSQASRIVQIPADQVYCRVLPPPHNNNISSSSADRQNPSNNDDDDDDDTSRRHRSKCFSSTRSRIFLIFIISILLLIIIACIVYLSLSPKSPTFIMDSLSLKPENGIVTYNLSMEASNPNSHIGFYYLEGGSASLSHNKQEIAHGTPPEFYNGKKETRVFDLLLNSSWEALSEVLTETIMKENDNAGDDDKYSNGKVPLVVFIRLPVKIKVGKLKLWKMKMKITCDVSIFLSSSQKSNVDLEHHYCKNAIH
ncbi:NDR1/HIN1-like protein 13 [Neltuma alba]|uniref:NDR1/HIN1-like protein 13 n=1 Tax=Neltuma alba TaxID=207710 RepID=UPI0010A3CD2F|nr:NDR1/HIN1-like protein 13 [Prosopis alba]